MKPTILILFLLLFTNNAKSQSYKRYYQLCNTADSLEYFGLLTQALDSLKSAFKSVPYVHSDEYAHAYQLSIKLSRYQDAGYFGKMAVIHSGEKALINTKSRAFQKSVFFENISDSMDYYLLLFDKRINHSYVHLIDSLIFIDQYIIRNNNEYKNRFEIDITALPANRFDLDSSNWNLLHKWMDSLGFPSEELVGKNGYNEVWAILHHNLRLKENEKYHPEIFDYVTNGYYRPNDLMVWYEQFQMQVYGTTFFTTWDGNISEENLKRVDQNRSAFYMKGLCSYSLKKNGRFMNRKW